MRLLIVLLLISTCCQAQQVLHKPVRLERQEGRVGELLSELNQLEGVVISYSSEVINLNLMVRLSGKEKTLEDYIRVIIQGQAVRYLEQDGKVFIIAMAPLKKKFTISGYVTDKKTGERLIGASVYIPSKGTGTTSNNYGFYSITLEEDTFDLHTSYTGFLAYAARVPLHAHTELNIALEHNVVSNPVVVVNSEGKRNLTRAVGKTEVPNSFIKSMPALMGEADVLKSLQLLPGVQAGNEGSSGLIVRGGSADQNLILLDGVTVYNASHAFGLFSIFNADAVHNVEIMKSGFPASYGGRLSSVVNVHMKEGDKHQFHGEGGIGMVFSKLTLQGPLKKGKSSFMVSGRRTYFDLLLKPLFNMTNSGVEVVPFFSDINVKANFPAGERDRFYFSLYSGKDQFRETAKYTFDNGSDRMDVDQGFGFSWGNITAMARWNHVFNNRTFSNFTFTHSRYRFNTLDRESRTHEQKAYEYIRRQEYFSGIQDWNFKADFDYLPAPDHFIKAGLAVTVHRYQPGVNKVYLKDSVVRLDTKVENNSMTSGEYDLYVEDDIRLSPQMKLNAGLRLSSFMVQGRIFTSLQPRLNWLYKLSDRWVVKASAGRMNQFIHLLTNGNMGLPTDLWLPVTEKMPPQIAHQVSAGITYRPEKNMDASMEVYFKSLKHVIEYSEGIGFTNAYNTWENIVERGYGTTYGAEWWLQKKAGILTGMISYTLSKSTRRFDNINEGKPFPYKYDRRHEVKLAAVLQPGKRTEFGFNWFFSTGAAISLPVAYYFDPVTFTYVDVYEGRNNFRMPNYHRLDVSMKVNKQKITHLRTWVFTVFNVYNRFNPFVRYKIYDQNNAPVFKEVAVFPFMISFAYQFKF